MNLDAHFGFLRAERVRRYTYPSDLRELMRFPRLSAAQVAELGLDVSGWQLSVNFQICQQKNLRFTFVRVLWGLTPDSQFPVHWQASQGVMPRGGYLYYRDNLDPVAQAQKLYDTLAATGDLGELPPVLDVEGIGNPTLTASKIRACAEKLTQLFGRKPIIYTGYYVWRDEVEGEKTWAAAYMLWIAAYPLTGWQADYPEEVLNYPPLIPAPWTHFDLWQWTAYAPAPEYGISGYTFDMDYCSPAFAALFLGQPPVPPPSTEEPPMKFTTRTTYSIRKIPNNTPASSKIGMIPAGVAIVAQEIRFTDANSAWVRIQAEKSWLTDPNYSGETWIAGIHDGQGPFLDFVPPVP